MAVDGYAEGTIKLVGVILYGMFNQAIKSDIISKNKNPVAMATIPRAKERKERIALTVEEQKLLWDYAADYSNCADLFHLALLTGMRNGEVRGLHWSDIDFDNRLIHVTGTLKYIEGMGHYKETPKTKISKRDIPMLNTCFELLSERKKKQEQEREFASEWWQPLDGLEELVFTTNDGKPITRDRVGAEIKKITKKVHEDGGQMRNFTYHTLRHTFATRGLEQGIDLKTMQTILGHKSFAMTADLYSHVLPTTKAKEMEKMEAVFKQD